MNSEEYKEICGLADVLPRNILKDTKDILTKSNMSESSIVEAALSEGTIEFPENYQGNSESSYHKVSCTAEEADRISDFLFENEAESVPVSGVATSETSRLVTLVNVWHELADYVQ
ncbi:MAG: hypothetical protein K6L80_07945 [Agarilytica sp.]